MPGSFAMIARLVSRFAPLARRQGETTVGDPSHRSRDVSRAFAALALLVVAWMVVTSDAGGAQAGRSTMTFVNSSGQTALVKLVGPSEQVDDVQHATHRLDVAP